MRSIRPRACASSRRFSRPATPSSSDIVVGEARCAGDAENRAVRSLRSLRRVELSQRDQRRKVRIALAKTSPYRSDHVTSAATSTTLPEAQARRPPRSSQTMSDEPPRTRSVGTVKPRAISSPGRCASALVSTLRGPSQNSGSQCQYQRPSARSRGLAQAFREGGLARWGR